jgi:Rad3-related DNA helicase
MIYRSPEQTQYAKLIEGAIKPGAPLLAGAAAGLGKTHGFSIPLIASRKRIAICLSTRQLIDQYLKSDALQVACGGRSVSVVALQSRRDFTRDSDYRSHKKQALEADLLITTHAAAFIDSFNPEYAQLRSRDVVLFDEADLLADAADLRSTFSISAEALKDCGAMLGNALSAAKLVKANAVDAEDRGAASSILYALENPAWYKVVGYEEDGALTLKHRLPGRMLKRLVADVPRCIFTSGTLQVSGRFDYFVKALGLTAIAPESRHIDPVIHGSLDVQVASDEMSINEMAGKIKAAKRPTLVLTTSHKKTFELGQLLPEATIREPGEPLTDAVARCPDDGILIAAGAWSGLDAPRLRWKTLVIPKTPYGVRNVLDGHDVGRYIDSKVVAIRRTNQGLHRGLRTPDAQCTLLLLDPRSSRSELREAIPSRFKVDWVGFEEGGRELVEHMKAERNESLRKAALKHYGEQCMWVGCAVTLPHLLDVHHCNPISLGQRRTTMSDVKVLCKNHHAEEHHRMRMSSLDALDNDLNQIESKG